MIISRITAVGYMFEEIRFDCVWHDIDDLQGTILHQESWLWDYYERRSSETKMFPPVTLTQCIYMII